MFLPCKSEKYKSVAFFIISGLQLESVNSSNRRVRDNLKSLYGGGIRKINVRDFTPKCTIKKVPTHIHHHPSG